MTTQLDFSIIEKAGVSQGQFGRLCGVSRITVNTWVSGVRSPKKTRLNRVSALLNQLGWAVSQGKLPVPARSHAEQTQRVLDTLPTDKLGG